MSVSVAFHSTLFFESLSAEISPAGKEIVEKIATSIAADQTKNGRKYKIVVEGHTDSVGGDEGTLTMHVRHQKIAMLHWPSRLL